MKLGDIKFKLKYYLWNCPKTWLDNIDAFFCNLWRFRKILWRHRTWDYSFCIDLFADSLEWLSKDIENGYEEERSAIKKVNAINELVLLLRHMVDDTEYGTFDENNDKMYKENRKIVLDRIHEIIVGQDIDVTPGNKGWYDEYVEKFDGTGIESWWN